MKKIILGTRGSKLALWQANHVSGRLSAVGHEVEIQVIKTQGDKVQHLGFDKLEGKGFFTKEIEDALIAGKVDFAVHSMKDLPTTQPDGLVLGGVSERADARDTMIIHEDKLISKAPISLIPGAVIGTSSVRRKVNLNHLFSDIELKDIRGNVPTRIQKLRDREFDAILLAKAGLDRLEIDLSEFHVFHFHPSEFIPAPAQGVLAYQCREEDKEMRNILLHIHSQETAKCTNIERKILQLVEGGCHVPLGAYCHQDANAFYHVHACYAQEVDHPLKRVKFSQSTSHKLADKVFADLMK